MEIALGIPTIADPEDTGLTDSRRINNAAAQPGVGQNHTHLQPAKLSRRVFNGAPEAASLLPGCSTEAPINGNAVKRNGDNTVGVLRSFGVRKIKEDRCAAQRGAAQR
ncbi:hypothetical protein [Bradyrhizobium sp. DASA03007]|uniref:hypothetical protein n=1 Tax=unclassified Bradyrhizobium TaxID=2631580 RepID=UPI003F6F8218